MLGQIERVGLRDWVRWLRIVDVVVDWLALVGLRAWTAWRAWEAQACWTWLEPVPNSPSPLLAASFLPPCSLLCCPPWPFSPFSDHFGKVSKCPKAKVAQSHLHPPNLGGLKIDSGIQNSGKGFFHEPGWFPFLFSLAPPRHVLFSG